MLACDRNYFNIRKCAVINNLIISCIESSILRINFVKYLIKCSSTTELKVI